MSGDAQIGIEKSIGSTSTVKTSHCGVDHACSEKTPAYLAIEQGEAFEKAKPASTTRRGTRMPRAATSATAPRATTWPCSTPTARAPPRTRRRRSSTSARRARTGAGTGARTKGITLAHGEPPRLEPAFAAFKKGCELGSIDGCYEAGRCYMHGTGVAGGSLPSPSARLRQGVQGRRPAGVRRVRRLLRPGQGHARRPAARRQDPRRELRQGPRRVVQEPSGSWCARRPAPPKDPKRMVAFFEKACTGKDGAACNELGLAVEHGQGAPRDRKRATELYGQGCDLDEAVACANFGLSVRDGLGAPKDPKRAATAFEKAPAPAASKRGCELRKKLPGSAPSRRAGGAQRSRVDMARGGTLCSAPTVDDNASREALPRLRRRQARARRGEARAGVRGQERISRLFAFLDLHLSREAGPFTDDEIDALFSVPCAIALHDGPGGRGARGAREHPPRPRAAERRGHLRGPDGADDGAARPLADQPRLPGPHRAPRSWPACSRTTASSPSGTTASSPARRA